MDSSATLKKLKEQGELLAMKKLQSLFSTSDQLEQIQQHKNRIDKRKNIIEAQLKSAIQSHFISVNSCMEQLQEVNQSVDNVRGQVYSIEDEYRTISHLETTLHELRLEANRHKQLKSALENVDNVLCVNELAQKARNFIDNPDKPQLLHAHKCLLELEKCRNDILAELGDPTDTGASQDIKLVDEFYKCVKEIQLLLERQVLGIIGRMLNTVRKQPDQIVTALRIIEREEILDEDWRKKKNETKFMPSDRPKRLKEKCFNEIRKRVEERFQGCRYNEREEDESWFSKQLGNVCGVFVQDLEVVKKLIIPCFPPSYNIFDKYVEIVHNVLQTHLQELVDTNQLDKQEFFVLLSWQDTYKSSSFMQNPKIKVDINKMKDLLDENHYNLVLNKHNEYRSQRLSTFFQNALDKNVQEWSAEPTTNHNGYYQIALSNDINTIVGQEIFLINSANDPRFTKATLSFLLEQLDAFIFRYREKIIDFKINHFKNPELLRNLFTIRMIAIANDCLEFKKHILNLRKKFETLMDKDEVGGPNDKYQQISNHFTNLSSLCIDYIIEDMTKCLEDKCFKSILTNDWLENDQIMSIILATSSDYLGDFMHLDQEMQTVVLYKWHIKLKTEYLKGFLQNLSTRFLTKRSMDEKERIAFSNKVAREILQLEHWFNQMTTSSPNHKLNNDFNFDFSVLNLMNKIIKADDVEFIGVEIGALIKKFPEFTSEMLKALLMLRNDISSTDFKDKFESYCTGVSNQKKPDEAIVQVKKELKIAN